MQGGFGIRVFQPEFFEPFVGNDVHGGSDLRGILANCEVFDKGLLFHLRQQSHQLLIATRRGTPFHLQRLSPLPDETVVEGFDADVEGGEGRGDGNWETRRLRDWGETAGDVE